MLFLPFQSKQVPPAQGAHKSLYALATISSRIPPLQKCQLLGDQPWAQTEFKFDLEGQVAQRRSQDIVFISCLHSASQFVTVE